MIGYTTTAGSVEFTLGSVVETVPRPLKYVKIDNVSNKIYVNKKNGDITFEAKNLPINGYATMTDLYNNLKTLM